MSCSIGPNSYQLINFDINGRIYQSTGLENVFYLLREVVIVFTMSFQSVAFNAKFSRHVLVCVFLHRNTHTFTGPLLNTCLVAVNVNHCFPKGFPEAAESARLTQQLWAREAPQAVL